jgi:3-oxoacyl-[acyl-carrier-protein] synthase-3
MAMQSINGLEIRGMSAAVPKEVEDNLALALLPEREREAFIAQTGIRYRRVAPRGITASDLGMAAATSLLDAIGWQPSEIDVLILVTQTPDYIIPNTASVIHQRLGLAKQCMVMDINLGCSGYVYGLSVIGALLKSMPMAKGLLLVGDCSSSVIAREDRSTWPLFSDAGSATAIEHTGSNNAWHFNLQSDGTGYTDIMIHDGGSRHPYTDGSKLITAHEGGIYRSPMHMSLHGINIFNFALREVQPNITSLLAAHQISTESIDYFLFHQANLLLLEAIRKKLKLDPERVPYSLYYYGNTSSASIPLTIIANLTEKEQPVKQLLLSGFGVGLSWGSVVLTINNPVLIPIIEI